MKGGLTLRKMSSLSMGDNMQFEASRRPCGVAVLFKVAILNMNLKLRHCFVTETCFMPENVHIHVCFTSGDYIKQLSHKDKIIARL